MLTLNLALELILLIAIGLFAVRAKIVDDRFDKSLSSFILNIALPCMIVKSLRVPFSIEELKNCGTLLLLSLLVFALSAVVGQVLYLACGKTASGRILRFGAMFCNFTFVGMPVVESLYGQQGLFYFVVFIVPMRMIYYSAAKPLLSPPGLALERQSFLQNLKGWLSPPVVAVLVGLVLYVTQLPLPAVVGSVIDSVGSICSPLGMILCGISLGKYDIKKLLSPRYLLMPLIRNLLLPGIFLLVMMVLPVSHALGRVVVIFAALPVASLMAAFTIQYDPSPDARLESAGSVFLSTVLSAATIPLWAALVALALPV